MKFLVVEDDQKIKADSIDDVVASLDAKSDWAQNQQEAVALLKAHEYDLVLLDLQIPSRPGGKPLAEFGKNTLRQVHEIKGKGVVPVILMTGYHQSCVDMASDLHDIGVAAYIAKPFPASGRTLTAVIEETLAKHRSRKKSGPPPSQRIDSDSAATADWLTVTEAAELLQRDLPWLDIKKAQARVSAAAGRRKFRTNGKQGKNRRVDQDTFSTWRLAQRDRGLDSADDRGAEER